jgi:hypothetical protein
MILPRQTLARRSIPLKQWGISYESESNDVESYFAAHQSYPKAIAVDKGML